eukprot:scaffold181218_cov27-Tisochrysis_lutea.AAC.1
MEAGQAPAPACWTSTSCPRADAIGQIKELEDELGRSKVAHAQLRAEVSASQQAMRRMEIGHRTLGAGRAQIGESGQ